MDPLHAAFLMCLGAAGLCWLLGVVTREHSWVDRLWSILPPLYVAWFASASAAGDARPMVMTILAALWGVRLTYNFARKGGYRPGGEDYRWVVLRRRLPPRVFAVFALVFVALTQNVLLLLLALPAHAAVGAAGPWSALDTLATILFALFLVGETVADQQQWRFQCDKRARGAAYGPQFLTRGLFRYSRHPNFFCEMAMWWTFYLFSVGAGAGWCNPTIAGPLLLTALMHGSTGFTEQLSREKYPTYADYQQTTSRLVPWFPRRPGR